MYMALQTKISKTYHIPRVQQKEYWSGSIKPDSQENYNVIIVYKLLTEKGEQ